MQTYRYKILGLGVLIGLFMVSCEDFLEVETPNHTIISQAVFDNDETALSAMTGIYHELFRASYSNGSTSSVTLLAGLAANEVQYRRDIDFSFVEFQQNDILPNNSRNLSLWLSAYNIIYMTNSLLEGLGDSGNLSEPLRSTLEGEAKFVRAFTYFYLVNLYGDVPLILTTSYKENAVASREKTDVVYQQILSDLTDATNLLEDEYRTEDRTSVNRFAVLALLARINLYLGNWEEAERMADMVLNNTKDYELKEDLNDSFLANSQEAIWQLSPIGRGNILTMTWEGNTFLFYQSAAAGANFILNNDLVNSFEDKDQRLLNWVGYNEEFDFHYPLKYKDYQSIGNITEYSMVLRLAEQYLIRAEARARQDNLLGAMADLDILRKRAGVDMLSHSVPQVGKGELLNLILEEREKELFTEWGHRWFDVQRLDNTSTVPGEVNLLFPIPQEELRKNPNLEQNPNY